MTNLTFSQISSLLFRACDDLHGNMDASEYKAVGSTLLDRRRSAW